MNSPPAKRSSRGRGGVCQEEVLSVEFFVPHLFNLIERGPSLWPADVKCGVGDDFGDLFSGDSIQLRRDDHGPCREELMAILRRHKDQVQEKLRLYQENLELLNRKIALFETELKEKDLFTLYKERCDER